MRKLSSVFAILSILMLGACSSELKPLKVDYQVTTMQEYEQNVKASKPTARFSDYQVSEIGYSIGSVKILCLGEKVFLADITRDALDIDSLKANYPEYQVDFICKDEVNTSNVLVFTDDITDAVVLEKFPKSTAYQLDGGTVIYPITEEMQESLKKAPYKESFIEYVKETMRLG